MIDGPFGQKPMVYADYVASGRALMQVERFVLEQVLPYYANSHTEASYCGGFMTRLRSEARAAIGACCGASQDHAVIFAGAGATAGINRLTALFGVGPGTLVIIGPYEHHSNILPWRESGAEVIEVPEASKGGPDLDALADALAQAEPGRRIVCAFSAASNVTGIVTDVVGVTRLAKSAGALMIWDYAGGAPYLPIAMTPAADAPIDAIVVSPHKFIGGPGASGVLVVRRDAVVTDRPTWPGGGTVRFVSPTAHDYSASLEAREEAGTPNVMGDIRAALAFLVKDAIGAEAMSRRNKELTERALAAWSGVGQLELLGSLGSAEAADLLVSRAGRPWRPCPSTAGDAHAQRPFRHPGARRLRLRRPVCAPAARHRPGRIGQHAAGDPGRRRDRQARLHAPELQRALVRREGGLHPRQRCPAGSGRRRLYRTLRLRRIARDLLPARRLTAGAVPPRSLASARRGPVWAATHACPTAMSRSRFF